MTKFKLVLPSLATALSLSAAMLLCGCAEAEISYPLSAYTNHPVGDAIAQYLSEQDALTFPDEDMEEALSQFGVEVVSAETLRERLGDEAEAVLGEHCTYLYTEREFTTHGDTLLSPAVYVISADENRYFTPTFTPENPGGARWDSYYVSVHDILSRQYLPAEDGGYDCIALSDFAFVRVYCTEHYIFPAGHVGSTQSEYIYTQYAPYFDDAVTPMQQNVGIREDMRLQETTIIIGGVEIGAVTLSRGRE